MFAKGGGKSAAKKAPQVQIKSPATAQAARVKVSPKRLNGMLTAWKGKFGWIVPNEPINHPTASMRGGKVYVAHEDVEAEIAGVGHPVSFVAYADSTGIGAMHVRPGKAPAGVQKAIQKPGAKAAAAPKSQKAPNAAPKEQPAPDKTKREQVSASPIMGTLVKLRGKVGWIKPTDPLDDVDASKRGGNIYLHMTDVDGEEHPVIGATVMFFLYKDDSGLGAEHCQIVEQGTGEAPATNGAEANGTKKTKNKKVKGKAAANGGAPKEKGPSGPDLPRERLTTEPVEGEITFFRTGKFGWIKPTTPFEHADAGKRDGKIWVAFKDVTGEPTKGATVSFQVYADASGLGAEECLVA